MQRTLIRLVKVTPLGFWYGITALVIPFYVLFDGKARRVSYRFFRERMGYGRLKAARHVFINMFGLGKVVIDRFAAYAGKRFGLVCDHLERYDQAKGAQINFSCHMGNYEMGGYMFHSDRPMRVLVYAGETATVMQNRSRMFGETNISMIPVSPDMSHLFAINAALSSGEIVSIPADRTFGSRKTLRIPFLGDEAAFPAGPFTLAVQREVPALAVFVLKESTRDYRIILENMHIPTEGSTAEKVESLAREYVAALEKVVRQYPDQWYNFYDFWAE